MFILSYLGHLLFQLKPAVEFLVVGLHHILYVLLHVELEGKR